MKVLLACLGVVFLYSADILVDKARASESWQSASKYKRVVAQMKRKGMYPTSLACRNDPAVTNRLKAQTKIVWKKNTKGVDWAMYVYKGPRDWRPGSPFEPNNWRKIYRKRFTVGASGAYFNCSL